MLLLDYTNKLAHLPSLFAYALKSFVCVVQLFKYIIWDANLCQMFYL